MNDVRTSGEVTLLHIAGLAIPADNEHWYTTRFNLWLLTYSSYTGQFRSVSGLLPTTCVAGACILAVMVGMQSMKSLQ